MLCNLPVVHVHVQITTHLCSGCCIAFRPSKWLLSCARCTQTRHSYRQWFAEKTATAIARNTLKGRTLFISLLLSAAAMHPTSTTVCASIFDSFVHRMLGSDDHAVAVAFATVADDDVVIACDCELCFTFYLFSSSDAFFSLPFLYLLFARNRYCSFRRRWCRRSILFCDLSHSLCLNVFSR